LEWPLSGRFANPVLSRAEHRVTDSLVILYEDPHCLAVVKPPGQFTQGSWAPAGETTLETAVRQYLDPANPGGVYLGIVHRLDRPTSGLLIWAKTPKAARRTSSQFERRAVTKEYWAIVCAESLSADRVAECGDEIWTDWLSRANQNGVVKSAEPNAPGTREAITRVRFERTGTLPPQYTWLRLWPQTGRTHQLRVQTANRRMPIVGDSTYGSVAAFPVPEGIALHARSLALRHPITGAEIRLIAPLPDAWTRGGLVVPETAGEV
jgi:23S rRNA pseudouridine1911/1915/1917 synthase